MSWRCQRACVINLAMKPAQSYRNFLHSSAVPSPGEKPTLRDIGWLVRYAVQGLWRLVRAAIAFRAFVASDIVGRNKDTMALPIAQSDEETAHIARIAYVLPRISRRLPWRSDCLVQAMAGQDWLAASKLASELQIGVEKPEHGEFAAHAWLVHDGNIVTGGDISRYAPILASNRQTG